MADKSVKQFNVYLPLDLIREIKYAAIDQEMSLSAMVETAMKKHLAELRSRTTEEDSPDPRHLLRTRGNP